MTVENFLLINGGEYVQTLGLSDVPKNGVLRSFG